MSPAGLSAPGLRRMHDVMAAHVERGAAPGAVTFVSRGGEVHVDAIGTKSSGGGDPIGSDTIFRITSMTKPVAAVAAMILVEECTLRLDDPVDAFLPELADRQVLKRLDGPLDDTVPARRPITLRDLLTFRFGFGLVLGPPRPPPIVRAADELELMTLGPPTPPTPHGPDEWMRRFGRLPLMHQPGEEWRYNSGSHVLGVLMARAADQPLERFLRERIFEPLGMRDTGFHVPAAKLDRFLPCYQADLETGALELLDGVTDSQWSRPPPFPDASAGLVSTVDDYRAFGQMLLDGGRVGSERILSRPSVELMTTNQLAPTQQQAASDFLGDNRGWGFGMSVVTRREDVASEPGRFGWDGGYGTSWSTDPTEGMVAILMTQCLGPPQASPLFADFWTSVYAAIDD